MTQHAKERALQRYNTELTDDDIEQMCNIIKQNNHIAVGICEDNKNKKFCYLKYNHIPYKVLYHNNGKSKTKIITIYPLDVDEYNAILDAKHEEKLANRIAYLKSLGYIVYKRKGKNTARTS